MARCQYHWTEQDRHNNDPPHLTDATDVQVVRTLETLEWILVE